MSFKEIPREALENFDDPGLVYTRNKYGRLHSPPGYHPEGKSSKSYLSKETLQGAQCSLKLGSSVYGPQSLFLICLDFVARNINIVESLIGFPDIIGEQLFKHTTSSGLDQSRQTLKLFCDAYGDLVLRSLSLAEQHLFVNNHIEYLQCFTMLSELDLSHCKLGDEHEVLIQVGEMVSVKRLSLKNNCLSDAGVAKLTLPCRMFGAGLTQLVSLDLSLNPSITDKTIKYLGKFAFLEKLNLSGSKVTVPGGVRKLQETRGLCLTRQIEEFAREKFVKNSGWACHVVQELVSRANISTKKTATDDRAVVNTFYKSKSRTRSAAQVSSHRQEPSSSPAILLQHKTLTPHEFMIRVDLTNCNTIPLSESLSGRRAAKKRKRGVSPPKAMESDSDEDGDLMNSYLSYESDLFLKKKTSSLLRALDETS